MSFLIPFPSNWRLDGDLLHRDEDRYFKSLICPLLINNTRTDYLVKIFDKSMLSAINQERQLKKMLGASKYFIFAEEFYKNINGTEIGMKIKRGICDFYKIITDERMRNTIDKPFFLYQVLLALRELHSKSLVFLDLKSENIIVTKINQPYVFIALCDHESTVINGNYQAQTYSTYYTSPEFFTKRKVSPAHDIFSLGVIAYSLYLISHPFSQIWDISQIRAKLRRPDQQMFQNDPRFNELDEDVQDFLRRCLEINPEKRATCTELLNHNLFKNHGISESFVEQQRKMA